MARNGQDHRFGRFGSAVVGRRHGDRCRGLADRDHHRGRTAPSSRCRCRRSRSRRTLTVRAAVVEPVRVTVKVPVLEPASEAFASAAVTLTAGRSLSEMVTVAAAGRSDRVTGAAGHCEDHASRCLHGPCRPSGATTTAHWPGAAGITAGGRQDRVVGPVAGGAGHGIVDRSTAFGGGAGSADRERARCRPRLSAASCRSPRHGHIRRDNLKDHPDCDRPFGKRRRRHDEQRQHDYAGDRSPCLPCRDSWASWCLMRLPFQFGPRTEAARFVHSPWPMISIPIRQDAVDGRLLPT